MKSKNKAIAVILIIFFLLLAITSILVSNNNILSREKSPENPSSIQEESKTGCTRTEPYPMPDEFVRALSIINQRAYTMVSNPLPNQSPVSKKGNFFYGLTGFENCINVQYSSSPLPDATEAFFKQDVSTPNNLQIVVDNSYKNFDDLTIAILLAHELTHTEQFLDTVYSGYEINCYTAEAEAFLKQYQLIQFFNEGEKRLIFSTMQDNASINPVIAITLSIKNFEPQAVKECTSLKTKNGLSETDYEACFWGQVKGQIIKLIKSNSTYVQQCENN